MSLGKRARRKPRRTSLNHDAPWRDMEYGSRLIFSCMSKQSGRILLSKNRLIVTMMHFMISAYARCAPCRRRMPQLPRIRKDESSPVPLLVTSIQGQIRLQHTSRPPCIPRLGVIALSGWVAPSQCSELYRPDGTQSETLVRTTISDHLPCFD